MLAAIRADPKILGEISSNWLKQKIMCKDCFDRQNYGFPSQSEFEKFERNLDFKCKSGKIKILESKIENEIGFPDFRMYFQCKTCGEKFVMSIPDNADRGYFLTQHNAIEYHKNKRKNHRKNNIGCIIFISVIIIIIYIKNP